jgi:hypothetical protein
LDVKQRAVDIDLGVAEAFDHSPGEVAGKILTAEYFGGDRHGAVELNLPVPAALWVSTKAAEGPIRYEISAHVKKACGLEQVRQLSAKVGVESKLPFGSGEPHLEVGLYLMVRRIVRQAKPVEVAAHDTSPGARDTFELRERLPPLSDPLEQML